MVSNKAQGTECDDQELLSRFRHDNDETAFMELVQRYQRPLYSFVWRHIGQHEETADICQQVFIQVFNKAQTFRGDASFKTWLYQIALNQCRNWYRSQQRHPVDLVAPEVLTAVAADIPALEADGEADQRVLNQAIHALPEKQRQTLYLHLYQDCSFQEVATIMDCPPGTAKANYHHAIMTLRKLLKLTER